MSVFVDLETNVVWAGRRKQKLTPVEAEFLYVLVRNVGRILSYETLWNQVQGHITELGESSTQQWARVYACRSRKILEELGVDATIEATRNRGYRLVFGETDPDDEYIVRCLKHRNSVEEFLRGRM